MPTITIHTEIKGPREVIFNLARSVDLHVLSTSTTNERIIEGKNRDFWSTEIELRGGQNT